MSMLHDSGTRWVCITHGITRERCDCKATTAADVAAICEAAAKPAFQFFWKCQHHESAIENFFAKRTVCEWDCHMSDLKWHHSGFWPMPKSWGGSPKKNVISA